MAQSEDQPNTDAKSETASAIRDSVGGFAAKALALITTSRDSFADLAGMAGIYEIQAANIALRRTHREDVKGFAQQMIRDHTDMAEKLRSMLGSMNAPIKPVTKLNALFQTLIDDLNGASNDDFDHRYIAQQKTVHDVAIDLFETFRDHGDNSALRELCKLALPVLERHRQMAEKLEDAVDNGR